MSFCLKYYRRNYFHSWCILCAIFLPQSAITDVLLKACVLWQLPYKKLLAMKSTQEIIGVLNDLIRINNDRVAGYEKAIENAKSIDIGLQTIFSKMKSESIKYTAELHNRILQLGGEPADNTTVSGKIYRAWMDVKATFTGKDRASLLGACEYGEDAAQKAYQDALDEEGLPVDIVDLIAQQKSSLRQSHNEIKAMRDMEKSVS